MCIVWVNKKLVGTSPYVPICSGSPVWLDANFKIHTTQTAAGNRSNELSSWWMIIWEPKTFLFLLAILREHLNPSYAWEYIFSMSYVPSKCAVFSFHDKLYCNIVDFIHRSFSEHCLTLTIQSNISEIRQSSIRWNDGSIFNIIRWNNGSAHRPIVFYWRLSDFRSSENVLLQRWS